MNTFVVFHRKSGVLLKIFNKESSAKRSKTCMNRNAGADVYAYTLECIFNKEIAGKASI